MFKILETDERIEYRDNLDTIPTVRFKYKDMLSCGNQKYSYDDFTKVYVDDKRSKIIASPKIFTADEERKGKKEIDYAPIYAIGMLELLGFSNLYKPELLERLYSKLMPELAVFTSYAEVDKYRNKFKDENYVNEPIYNLLHLMRSDYQSQSYDLVMSFLPLLMICYEEDKAKFTQIFLEVMDFSTPYIQILCPEALPKTKSLKEQCENMTYKDFWSPNFKLDMTHKFDISWLNKDEDLHFHYIKYLNPATNKALHITDCRGFCILQSFRLYYQMLMNHGEMLTSSVPSCIDYKSEDVLNSIIDKVKKCVGDDYQADALKGKVHQLGLSERGYFIVVGQEVFKYSVYVDKLRYDMSKPRMFYEDAILFKKAYNVTTRDLEQQILKGKNPHSRNYSTAYVKFNDMLSAVAQITQDCQDLRTDVEVKKIAKLEEDNRKLKSDLISANSKVTTLDKEVKELRVNKGITDKTTELQNEVERLTKLLESKNEIIEQQTDEIVDLNKKITHMFSEEEQMRIAHDNNIPLEEKVELLNEFSFCMVGGLVELDERLKAKGWTNFKHIDNETAFNNTIAQADFFVLFTSFVGHALAYGFDAHYKESGERTVYYKGVNVDILIDICYEFVVNYFK